MVKFSMIMAAAAATAVLLLLLLCLFVLSSFCARIFFSFVRSIFSFYFALVGFVFRELVHSDGLSKRSRIIFFLSTFFRFESLFFLKTKRWEFRSWEILSYIEDRASRLHQYVWCTWSQFFDINRFRYKEKTYRNVYLSVNRGGYTVTSGGFFL